MAYLRSLEPEKCDWPGCDRKQKKELIGNRNESLGKFCTGHAIIRLRDRQTYENGATQLALMAHQNRMGLGGPTS